MANNKITYTDDYHAKMREYSRAFVKRKKLIREIGEGKKPLRNVPISFIRSVQPTHINFLGSDLDNPTVCSEFGCKNHLTTEQQLYGTKCIHHQKKNKLDITLFISQSKIA